MLSLPSKYIKHTLCILIVFKQQIKAITMKLQQPLLSLSLLLLFLFLFQCTSTFAQSPTQPPTQPLSQPPPQPPTQLPPQPPALPPMQPLVQAPPKGTTSTSSIDVSNILLKVTGFSTFLRLLRSTQMGDQINSQLNLSNQGLTIFVPSDSAFSSLKPGTLNSLTDQQKVQLIQFHVVPTHLSIPQFQTVTNPVRTLAGDNKARFPLNIISYGSSVNMSTGLVNASVSGTIYTDNQLAIYQVDKVLLPIDIFVPRPPAPAPAPSLQKPTKATPKASDSDSAAVVTSYAMSISVHKVILMVPLGVVVFTTFS